MKLFLTDKFMVLTELLSLQKISFQIHLSFFICAILHFIGVGPKLSPPGKSLISFSDILPQVRFITVLKLFVWLLRVDVVFSA